MGILKTKIRYCESSVISINYCIIIIIINTRYNHIILPVRKRMYPFFYFFFFPRCPVCGEWCKLHWLLLDTASFDWNTRRSRGHKMFKMAPTKQQKAFCAVEYAKTTSVTTVQRNFRRQFVVDPPDKNSIKRWHTQLMETGCLCKGKSTGRCLCVAYAKAKAPDVVFAYSTAQNAYCCFVGAILNILCPGERWVFQSKLGVSSSNQCNLHHSPPNGHLEKKIKKGYNLFLTRYIFREVKKMTDKPSGRKNALTF